MIARDELKEFKATKIPDGLGGFTLSPTPSYNTIRCNISISNNIEKAKYYGVMANEILEVISFEQLTNNEYEYANKKYSLRGCIKQGNRLFFSTLVEVK